jgi:hypothetical protein
MAYRKEQTDTVRLHGYSRVNPEETIQETKIGNKLGNKQETNRGNMLKKRYKNNDRRGNNSLKSLLFPPYIYIWGNRKQETFV